jgi:GT2 family glycosyltransferase
MLSVLTGPDGSTPHIVVLNIENDPSVHAVVAAYPEVTDLPAANNGYAAAVNLGAAVARERITVFMNDDLCLDRTDLSTLVARVACGATDVAVPRVVDANGDDEGTIRAFPTPGRLLLEWALTPDRPHGPTRRVQKWRRPTQPESVPAVVAALVAVRTELLLREPLPEEYFLYWEDIAWCWQLRRAGARIEIIPEVRVEHAGGRDDVRPAKQQFLARNAVKCVRQTQGRAAALLAWPIVVFWQLRLLATDGLRTVGAPVRPGRFAARTAGLYAALGAWREIA